jgi:hypothetical protein
VSFNLPPLRFPFSVPFVSWKDGCGINSRVEGDFR